MLKEWLENMNRTREVGVKLMQEFCKNQHLVRFVSANDTATSLEMMYNELKNIANALGIAYQTQVAHVIVRRVGQQAKEVAVHTVSKVVNVVQEHIPKANVASLHEPEELIELRGRHTHLFNKKEILRKSLFDYGLSNAGDKVSARQLVCASILALKSEIGEVVTKIRYFENHGEMPLVMVQTKDDVRREFLNARAEISRQKSIIKNAVSLQKRQTAQERLARAEKKLEEMDKKLKSYD
jgi:hypothetical protein